MTITIEDDEISTVRLTAADAATMNSRAIAARVVVRPSPLTMLRLDELLAMAETTSGALEARFASGDLSRAMALGRHLENLALRVACGTPSGWSEADQRIRLLFGLRTLLPIDGALRIMLDFVIEADCLEWDVRLDSTDQSSGAPLLH